MTSNVVPFAGKPQGNGGVASGGSGPHDPTMEARVAVLEQIAKQTSESLVGIRADLTAMRKDLKTDFDNVRDWHDRDFRLTFGVIVAATLGLAGLVAKGFHWL